MPRIDDPQPDDYEIGSRKYVVAKLAPLDVDGVRTLQVGTALFGLAFLVLLAFHRRLEAGGHLWWMWTCAAGFGLGCIGWDHCRRRRNARRSGELNDSAQE